MTVESQLREQVQNLCNAWEDVHTADQDDIDNVYDAVTNFLADPKDKKKVNALLTSVAFADEPLYKLYDAAENLYKYTVTGRDPRRKAVKGGRKKVVVSNNEEPRPKVWTVAEVVDLYPPPSSLRNNGRKLGEGAYGAITLVTVDGKQLAMKSQAIVERDLTDVTRAPVTEITFLKTLHQHPNIVKIDNIFLRRGEKVPQVCFTMPVATQDLQRYIDNLWRQGTVETNVSSLLQIAADIFSAMAYSHAHGICHLDLKPSNVLLSEELRGWVADFGIAENVQGLPTGNTNAIQTAPYEAPEAICWSREYGTPADVWSIGVILGEMFFNVSLFFVPGFKLEDIFQDQLKRIGVPSKEWFKKFGFWQHCVPPPEARQHPIYHDLHNTLLANGNTREFYKKLYGQQRYDQLVDMIHRCLTYDPELRIKCVFALQMPLFHGCKVTILHVDHPVAHLKSRLQPVEGKSDTIYGPLAQHLVEQFFAAGSGGGDLKLVNIAAASLSMKLLNFDYKEYDSELLRWMNETGGGKITHMQIFEMQLRMLNRLNWGMLPQ